MRSQGLQPALEEAIQLLMEGTITMSRIEEVGLRIDEKYLNTAIKDTKSKIAALEKSVRHSKEFKAWARQYGERMNLRSRQQLGRVIFDMMGHKRNPFLINKESKREMNSEAAFEHLRLPFTKDYFDLEKLKKGLVTYLYGIRRELVGGVLHPFFDLYTAESYRSSSSKPNLHNFPVRNKNIAEIVRTSIIPRPGRVFIEVDYGSQEVRVSCCYNGDPTLRSYITGGGDMHTDQCKRLYMLNDKELGSVDEGCGKLIRYCNPPEAPIWMNDLTFKPIGEIKVGDEVMGWHRPNTNVEKGKQGNKDSRKRLVASVVTAVNRHHAKIIKMTMASGRVIRCTGDHRWIDADSQTRGRGDGWMYPTVGGNMAHVVQPPKELPPDLIHTAGWLGGMYDGEGHRRNISQSPTHNPATCEALELAYAKLGLHYSMSFDNTPNGCNVYMLGGGIQGALNFLTWCKPIRKDAFVSDIRNRSSFYKKDRIIKIEPDGEGEVIGLTTTTGNYVAWGYASKNCAKNMFVFAEFYGSYFAQCAPHLWDAISMLELKTAQGKTLFEHLKSKGIKKLGRCDPEHEPVKGTFEYHIREVERQMWTQDFFVYNQWRKDWYALYQAQGGVNTLTGFTMYGYFKRNQILCDPIQGSAFHCLLWSLIQIMKEMRKRKMKSRVVNQVHDSMVFDAVPSEVPDLIEMVQRIAVRDVARHWRWITVPLQVEFEECQENWFKKKKMKVAA